MSPISDCHGASVYKAGFPTEIVPLYSVKNKFVLEDKRTWARAESVAKDLSLSGCASLHRFYVDRS